VVDILTIKYTEVGKMIELLKQSGFKVTIATISGDEMDADQVIVKPDIH
jgi:hypothetical protein